MITIHLVEIVFRNRVVDYINSNLYRFRGENRSTFSSTILAEVRSVRIREFIRGTINLKLFE